MAIYKETSLWGKWERKKELRPGKKVVLWDDSVTVSGGQVPTLSNERIEVDSPMVVKRVLVENGEMVSSEFLGGEKINEAELRTQGFLSTIGIKSKIVYKG